MPGPDNEKACAQCIGHIDGTPWAFPLADMRFPKLLLFCSEWCLARFEQLHGCDHGVCSTCEAEVDT